MYLLHLLAWISWTSFMKYQECVEILWLSVGEIVPKLLVVCGTVGNVDYGTKRYCTIKCNYLNACHNACKLNDMPLSECVTHTHTLMVSIAGYLLISPSCVLDGLSWPLPIYTSRKNTHTSHTCRTKLTLALPTHLPSLKHTHTDSFNRLAAVPRECVPRMQHSTALGQGCLGVSL